MKNENKKLTVQKDGLLDERSFLEFCHYDHFRSEKITNAIQPEFLRAAEKITLLSRF
jgi:hypothetical protein